jgi:TonB-dependent starch-binding outer membrane protein SusC
MKYIKTLLLFTLLSSGLTAKAFSYKEVDLIQAKSEKLSSTLSRIASHYKVNIIFDNEDVSQITIAQPIKHKSLKADLDLVLRTTNLSYKKMNEETYIIKKRNTSESVAPKVQAEPTIKKAVTTVLSGQVSDEESEELLIGATIMNLQSNQGAVTDIDGKFEITVDPGQTLEVSYTGYVSKKVTIGNETYVKIGLSKDDNLLDEVVVVGYGTQRKSDLTGAIATISEKELKQLPVTGLEQAMQGRSAGVYITQNSGSPGGAMSIRIRGTGSTLNAEPLYVIDGIPISSDNKGTSATFESDGGGQYSNALTTINPNDIESIEILKDASATAIYGARAANGVVLITTKKGKEGKKSVSYESYVGMQQLYKKIKVMDLKQYAAYIGDVNIGDVEEFRDLNLLGKGTDWQDVVFRNALMHNHQLSLSGGDKNTTFSVNGGLHKKFGIVEGSDFNRVSTKLNIDHNYNKYVKVGANLMASQTKENITFNDNSNGVIYTALLTPPMVAARTLSGEFGTPPPGKNIVLTFDNPLANAKEVEDVNRKSRLLGSFYTDIKIKPWLNYRTEVATDILYSNHNTFWPEFQRGTQSRRSRVRRNISNNSFWINKHLLTFNKTYDKKHAITLLGGFEAQEGKYEWIYASRDNLPNNKLQQINLGDAGTQQTLGGAGHWALLSYFGRLNYGLSDKYLLTATLRADGSSRFGANNKYGYFPSVAGAWRISQEDFIKSIEAIDNIKLRLGYGAVGNQEIGLYSFASNLRNVDVVIGNQLITAFAPDNIANPNVKWESSVQENIGLDLGFLNNKIEITIDLYNKISKDMLLPAILPATAGGLNPPFINIGKMKNSGLEVTLNTQNFAGKFNWKTSANVSFNRNVVQDLGSTGELTGIIQRVPVTRTTEGNPIGQYFGHKKIGIFKTSAEVGEAPFHEVGTRAGDIRFEDINNDNVINDLDKTFIGSPHPDFTANLINEFSYGNFDMNFFLRGVYGNEVYNMLRRDLAGTGAWHNQSVDIINRWSPTNLEGTEPRSNGNDPNQNRRVSDRFVEDGSYLRLQNFALGYNFSKNMNTKYKITGLRFYVSGQNLLTFTKYSGYDPEIGAFNQSPLINGVDNGRFPVARSITFGANLNF